MKVIKFNGIELLEKIRSNEIEMNTNINVYYDDVFRTTLVFDGYDLNWKAGEFKVAYFYDGLCHFEIEEEKEIEKFAMMYPINEGFNSEIGGLVSIYNTNFAKLKTTIDELIDVVNEIKRG